MQSNNAKNEYCYKILVIGPHFCGKSRLLTRIVSNEYRGSLESTFKGPDIRRKTFVFKNDIIKVSFYNSSSSEANVLRSRFLETFDCALVAFDISTTYSFDRHDFWFNLLRHDYKFTVPAVLVGCKSDLKDRSVSTDEGIEFAKKLGCSYIETSSLKSTQVDLLVQVLLNIIHQPRKVEGLLNFPS